MKQILFGVALVISAFGSSQDSVSELLKKYNTENIPYITVQELALPNEDAILLDAREAKEYNTSHLENAVHVGYDFFDINLVTKNITDKSAKIVVYCSLGIRSEDVAEQLKKEGYTNVYNLFGGIFEWKNNDFTVYDNNNEPTDDVHTFSEEWSQWLLKGNKIYD
nr:rhodanese-like domain-containing protein [Winogradskyella sp.]